MWFVYALITLTVLLWSSIGLFVLVYGSILIRRFIDKLTEIDPRE